MKRAHAIGFALLLLCATCVAAQPCDAPPASAVRALITAKNVRELDRLAARMPSHDGLRALYRARRYKLAPTGAEERRYFRSLPATREEFWCVYALTTPDALGSDPAISDVVDGMCERAARLARKLGFGHERVIQMALWSDGDIAYSAWDALDWLFENDPRLTLAAVQRLPEEDRRRVMSSRR